MADLQDAFRAANLPDWLQEAQRRNPSWWRSRHPLHIPVTGDGEMSSAAVSWAMRLRHSSNTAQNYAGDVAQHFGYLYDRGLAWNEARRVEIIEYLEYRRFDVPVTYAGEHRQGASASTVARNRMALHSFYEHAVTVGAIVANPVPRGNINITRGQVHSNVKWVTRKAYERWRNEGLRGIGSSRRDTMMMGERNAAYADLLYATGMRRSEAAGMLTVELPNLRVGQTLSKGRVPGSLTKNRPQRGRVFYVDDVTYRTITDYVRGARQIEVAHGIRSGRYEEATDALIAVRVSRRAGIAETVTVRDMQDRGRERSISLDELTAEERARTFAMNPDGRREPLSLWLGHGGGPLSADTWNDIFASANDRMSAQHMPQLQDGLHLRDLDAIKIHPHMLRHSFALRVFAISALADMERSGAKTRSGIRSYIHEQNTWLRVQNLLGHKDVSTTRDIYLAPVLGLEWDWILTSAAEVPSSLDQVLTRIAQADSRVIDDDRSDA